MVKGITGERHTLIKKSKDKRYNLAKRITGERYTGKRYKDKRSKSEREIRGQKTNEPQISLVKNTRVNYKIKSTRVNNIRSQA
jgi:hypothetical protein